MHYTVATLEDVHSGQIISLDKCGNQYQVGAYHTETKDFAHKKFATLDEAKAVFLQLASAIVDGCYSYEQRKAMLTS